VRSSKGRVRKGKVVELIADIETGDEWWKCISTIDSTQIDRNRGVKFSVPLVLLSQVNTRTMTNHRSITSIFRSWGNRTTMISSVSGAHISQTITSRKDPNTDIDGTYESITTEETSRTTLSWGRCPDSYRPPHESRAERPVLRKGSRKKGGKGVRRMTKKVENADTGKVNCVDTTGDGNKNCVNCVNC